MPSDAGAAMRPTEMMTLGDPFARVIALGYGDTSRLSRSLVASLLMYVGGVVAGFATSTDLHAFGADVLHAVTRARAVMEIEIAPPPPEPPPEEKPPEPVAEEAPPPTPKEAPPKEAPPPAPAQAGQVLAAEPDPDEPVDLTGNTFVQGTGDTYVGGVTSAAGTSKTAVRQAVATGVADSPGKVTAPVVAGPDLSREAKPLSGSWNDCGFPAEADIEQINSARVVITVTVGSEGDAKSATVVSDPGYGFGALAKRCAMRKKYSPGLDRGGAAITSTQTVKINFTRN